MISYKYYSNSDLDDEKLLEHLIRIDHVKHLKKNGMWISNLYIIVALENNNVVGHISLIKQPMKLLKKPLNQSGVITFNCEILMEMFVETFFVESSKRKQGIGFLLQKKALDLSCKKGCYQMRSWSTTDKIENYKLKFKLGFSYAPAILTLNDGEKIMGGYFVKRV